MSERAKRKTSDQVIADLIREEQEKLQRSTARLDALQVARAAATEPPRALTNCQFVLYYATRSMAAVEQAVCTECGNTSTGYERTWGFCPLCGSKIGNVERETTPHERLNRQAVRQAMAGIR